MKGRNMKRGIAAVIALTALWISSPPVFAEEGCVTDKCHQGMGKAQFVHGPVGAGQCVVCHTEGKPNHPTKSGSKDFKLAFGGGKDLCYACHNRMDANRVVHKPVATGDCIACHDPHQSNAELMLKKATTSELCFSCHENNKTKRAFVHGPVAAGDCNICHNPHSSPYPNLTEEKATDLCLLCHVDRKEEFTRKYVHKPVEEDCGKCHNAHATDSKFMLYGENKELCYRCHKETQKHIEESAVQHSALKKEPCTGCHTPHSSNFPRQLKAATKDICYVCHVDLGAQVQNAKNLHGPVKQNDCYACHDPHGSNYTKVLKKAFPPEFYMPYRTENYAICFDCHNKDIALNEFTTKLTDFRNGDTNMHFLHVNKEKGRSCKACHEVHAGNQEKHIRKEVPFGKNWKLPVNFTKTPTGGRCVVGCHKPKDYDRVNPVVY
ncbi:MAG: cytochrome C [Deltaproteobacteria bacterium]|nr:cytochrome C [Deltaproteobacteria bacterium]